MKVVHGLKPPCLAHPNEPPRRRLSIAGSRISGQSPSGAPRGDRFVMARDLPGFVGSYGGSSRARGAGDGGDSGPSGAGIGRGGDGSGSGRGEASGIRSGRIVGQDGGGLQWTYLAAADEAIGVVGSLLAPVFANAPLNLQLDKRSDTFVAHFPGDGLGYGAHFDGDDKCKITAILYTSDWEEG